MEHTTQTTLQNGYQDEMESAYNYIALAAEYGSIDMKKDFIGYAIEELRHANTLLEMFKQHGETPDKMRLKLSEQTDLMEFLIEYEAKEESATFYYDVLKTLETDENIKAICHAIQEEEQTHLAKIADLIKQLRAGAMYE